MYTQGILIGQLYGILGQPPRLSEIPTSDGGTRQVCNFSLALPRRGQNSIWVKVAIWGKAAQYAYQFLGQGHPVVIPAAYLKADESGNPPTYETKSGETRAEFQVNAYTFTTVLNKEQAEAKGGYAEDLYVDSDSDWEDEEEEYFEDEVDLEAEFEV